MTWQMVAFIAIALVAGGILGAVTMSLLAMSGRQDECARCMLERLPYYDYGGDSEAKPELYIDYSLPRKRQPGHPDDELPY